MLSIIQQTRVKYFESFRARIEHKGDFDKRNFAARRRQTWGKVKILKHKY